MLALSSILGLAAGMGLPMTSGSAEQYVFNNGFPDSDVDLFFKSLDRGGKDIWGRRFRRRLSSGQKAFVLEKIKNLKEGGASSPPKSGEA